MTINNGEGFLTRFTEMQNKKKTTNIHPAYKRALVRVSTPDKVKNTPKTIFG
jgi:hypothetical protein